MIRRALVSLLLAAVTLAGCGRERRAGELRLAHEVTVRTAEGERTYRSVVGLKPYQTHGRDPGGSGWGGITALATGSALRVPGNENDFLFVLVQPSPTPATPGWSQMELLQKHFGFPNATDDASWLDDWEKLSRSDAVVELDEGEYPGLVTMPANGWMDDARVIAPADAEQHGLRVLRYRLRITQEPVGADMPVRVRYRPSEARYRPPGTLGRSFFVADNER